MSAVRLAARRLWHDRQPIGALCLCLSVAITLVAVWFTLFNGFLIKPWPVRDPDTVLVANRGVSPAVFRYLRANATTVQLVAGTQTCRVDTGGGNTTAACRLITADYFDVLGLPLVAGRAFLPGEDRLDDPQPVVIISEGFWSEHYRRSPDAIGATLELSSRPFTIVGIAAARAFTTPTPVPVQLWFPLSSYPLLDPVRDFLHDPEQCCVDFAGRRRATAEAVSQELTRLVREFRGDSTLPLIMSGSRGIEQDWDPRATLAISGVFVAVGLVLLAAILNAALLQYGRGVTRAREFDLRRMLGASPTQLLGQVLVENVLLLTGIAGLVLAAISAAVALIEWRVMATNGDLSLNLAPDWLVAATVFVLSGIAVMGSGLAPLLRGTLTDRTRAIRWRTGEWLLGGAVMCGTILTFSASLLSAGIQHAQTHTGMREDLGRLWLRTEDGRYLPPERLDLLTPELLTVRGAEESVLVASLGVPRRFGRPQVEDGVAVDHVFGLATSPDFIRLSGARLLAGRLPADGDPDDAVVVNATLASHLWPGRDAIGRRFFADKWRTVIGVVGDLRGLSPGTAATRRFFDIGDSGALYVRTSSEGLAAVQARLAAIAPDVRIQAAPMGDRIAGRLDGPRLVLGFASVLGVLALVIAGTGVYGLARLNAERRRKDIGICRALGAGVRHIIPVVVRRIAVPAIIGTATGALVATVASPALRQAVDDVPRFDAVAALTVLAAVAVALTGATWTPIRSALRLNPSEVLRND
jgi:predicted permease